MPAYKLVLKTLQLYISRLTALPVVFFKKAPVRSLSTLPATTYQIDNNKYDIISLN